jgi:hypothetical protein
MFLSQESVLAQGFQIRNLNNPFYSSVYVILHHLQHMHTLRASPLAHVHIRFWMKNNKYYTSLGY